MPVTVPAILAQPVSHEFFFITGYRLFMVAVVAVAVAALFVLLRYTRLGMRIRAGTLDLETVSALGVNVAHAALAQFRRRHLPRGPRAACSPPASSASSRPWAPAC